MDQAKDNPEWINLPSWVGYRKIFLLRADYQSFQIFGICAFYLFILFIFGLVFNSVIIVLFFKVRKVRKLSNLFHSDIIFQLQTDFNKLLISLLVGELLTAAFGTPIEFLASARWVG